MLRSIQKPQHVCDGKDHSPDRVEENKKQEGVVLRAGPSAVRIPSINEEDCKTELGHSG